MQISKLYMNLQSLVSLDEIKQIKAFLDTKSEDGAGAVTHPDMIDMDDLIDLVKHKHQAERMNDSGSEMDMADKPGKRAVPDFYGRARDDSPSEVESLQKKIRRVLREKDDDAEFFSSKIR